MLFMFCPVRIKPFFLTFRHLRKVTFHGNNFQDLPDSPLFGQNEHGNLEVIRNTVSQKCAIKIFFSGYDGAFIKFSNKQTDDEAGHCSSLQF